MESKDSSKNLERLDLPITGMSCAACAARIEKGLGSVEGVAQANVNFAAEKATVFFDPARTDLPHLLIDKVKDLGYEVRVEKVLLPIQGMSCASCVSKVEKALRSTRGVTGASVNFATERASVEYLPEEVTLRDLKRAVEDAGYEVLEVEEEDIVEKERLARERELSRLKWKFITGLLLLVPILFFMWGASFLERIGISRRIDFFIQFLLATPVQFWAGWQFYSGFWRAAKNRTSDMNTLIAVGTSAAYIYSLIATFVPHWITVKGFMVDVYFDTSAAIIVLILLGRFLEARAKGRTSEAIKKLMGLQP